MFRFSGWHDDSFHNLPALSVTAPSSGRPVLVQRLDFTADDPGSRRLLKGGRYETAQRVQPGGTVELVSDTGAADPAEIASALALDSISAIVFFTDDDGQTGIVSAAARLPDLPDRGSLASLEIRQFTVSRRQNQGRFVYAPQLTLAETSGRSRASIRKMVFELLDVGAASQAPPLWNVPPVAAGDAISLVSGKNGRAPWFEIDSTGDPRGCPWHLVRRRHRPWWPGQRHCTCPTVVMHGEPGCGHRERYCRNGNSFLIIASSGASQISNPSL